jgi:glycosyltransferase involved in cell wall biosynthesis
VTTRTEHLRVLLIGNYANDRQESMLRFTGMLQDGLMAASCAVEVIAPRPFLGKLRPAGIGVGKWLGYVDKYLIFPIQLRRRLLKTRNPEPTIRTESVVVHICDHSNAPYAAHVCGTPCVVTCHDLGAVRGALGEPTYCPPSRMGHVLQRWILRSLARAARIVCDSTATECDVHRLLGPRCPSTEVVLLGQNQTLAKRPAHEVENCLAQALPRLDLNLPFLLHVGSSLARKNRDGVIRILHRVKDGWKGQLVFAGEALPGELQVLVRDLGLSDRVTVVERPDTIVLEALYNRAFALLFPSRFEGFGWPVIEAQACGCPVLCSDASSLPEVAGAGALIRPVEDEAGFAHDLLSLTDPAVRTALIERGTANLPRFEAKQMIDRYLAVYREVLAAA